MRLRSLIFFGCLFCLTCSCVGKKKFREVQYLVEQGERRERQLRAQLEYADRQMDYLTRRNGELDQLIGVLRRDKERLEADTASLGRRLRSMSDQSRMTQQELGSALQQCQQALQQTSDRLQAVVETVRQRDARLQTAFEVLRDSLDSIPAAPGAEVVFRDGRISVTLPNQLLFEGRSLRFSEAGEAALEKIAAVFNSFPDLEVVALGHTSNESPPRSYANNWDLSVRQAAAAVRLLTESFNVSANQLTAAGKGEFRPKVSNSDPEGQATNQRMEFVLSPRLDLLYRDILRGGP